MTLLWWVVVVSMALAAVCMMTVLLTLLVLQGRVAVGMCVMQVMMMTSNIVDPVAQRGRRRDAQVRVFGRTDLVCGRSQS